ncbi:MAG: DCC1-like thiol-disulfide oxidoreductase family protein [Terracidiphilus sp.]
MQGREQLGGRVLVVFDGRCGLCNASVRWLIRRDELDRLRFVAAEDGRAAEMLTRLGYDGRPETIVAVWEAGRAGERALERSEAVAALLGELPGPWPAVGRALLLVPRPVREWGYRVVAHWRHRIRGRVESCPLPGERERGRFL